MIDDSRPIACSLPARESRNQIGEWRALAAHQVVTERIEGGYAVTFDSSVTLAVEDLARREAACCEFLTIETTQSGSGVRLMMTSENPYALPVITLLMGGEADTG